MGNPRATPQAKTKKRSEIVQERIDLLIRHFSDPKVQAAIDDVAKETYAWLLRNNQKRNKDENRIAPWWPKPPRTADKYLLRNRKQQLLFTAYGNGLWYMIEELAGHEDGQFLLIEDHHEIPTALSYVPFALHHELIGKRFKNDSLDQDNLDDDCIGLNDIANRFDYDNASNVRDTYVDLMQTLGLWDVRYPDARKFEIRIGPVAHAFHMHALVPILEKMEPELEKK